MYAKVVATKENKKAATARITGNSLRRGGYGSGGRNQEDLEGTKKERFLRGPQWHGRLTE